MKKPNLNSQSANLFLCLIGSLIILANGCKKENNPVKIAPTPTPVTGPYLYVGGGTDTYTSIYWKISLSQAGAKIIRDTIANAGPITSIVTSGSDVYMAAGTGGYFKNSSFVPVKGAASIKDIALSGTNIYTAGQDSSYNAAAYWDNNTETVLGMPLGGLQAGIGFIGISGIAASGNNVFVSGYSEESVLITKDFYGYLWSNGHVQSIGGHQPGFSAPIVGVAISGSDIYVAGDSLNTGGGYWKNGVFTSINNGNFSPASIATFAGDTYITGSAGGQGAYWKNGILINFMPGNCVVVNAVALNGTDLYVLGSDTNYNKMVWKNGTLFATLGPFSILLPTCIAIGN
jgi:hypothetical protein